MLLPWGLYTASHPKWSIDYSLDGTVWSTSRFSVWSTAVYILHGRHEKCYPMVRTHPLLQCRQQPALWVLLSIRVGGVKINNDSVNRVDRRMDGKQLTYAKSNAILVHVVCISVPSTLDRSAFVLCDGTVTVSSTVHNIGAYFDKSLSMSKHVNQLVH